MNIDILIIAAHPDDAELCCAGTILKHVDQGHSIGMIDLTEGEMGTRGTREIRVEEAQKSAEILGLKFRENMSFKDYFFKNDLEHQEAIVKKIRKYKPRIILTNAISDRHPDHAKASQLVVDSVFLSGLRKFETQNDGKSQPAFRPDQLFHFIQNNYIEPDFVIDISGFWDKKKESIMAFKSQFYDPNSDEPESFISSKEFFHFIEGRHREMGHKIGVEFGEGFTSSKKLGMKSLFDII